MKLIDQEQALEGTITALSVQLAPLRKLLRYIRRQRIEAGETISECPGQQDFVSGTVAPAPAPKPAKPLHEKAATQILARYEHDAQKGLVPFASPDQVVRALRDEVDELFLNVHDDELDVAADQLLNVGSVALRCHVEMKRLSDDRKAREAKRHAAAKPAPTPATPAPAPVPAPTAAAKPTTPTAKSKPSATVIPAAAAGGKSAAAGARAHA